MIRRFMFFCSVILLVLFLVPVANATLQKDGSNEKLHNITVSNRLISIELPSEVKGSYIVKRRWNGIFIYDKASRKAGFGGFAFGLMAYKNPYEHAVMPGGMKVGELVNMWGELYDIVLIRPTDVQYDYVNKKSESYDILYNYAKTAAKTAKGKWGNKYVYSQGTKGEELYKNILKKHVTAVKEKWDSIKLEEENMSYMYNVLAHENKNVMDAIGYTYYDVNGDGIEELIIGEIASGAWKGIVYDMYTMVDRKPAHVMSGGARNRYYVCNNVFICNEYSGGAKESGWLVYILVDNSTELFPQVGFKYDGYENEKTPWFISYNFAKDKWENVSEEVFINRKKTFDGYKRFDYTPLSTLK